MTHRSPIWHPMTQHGSSGPAVHIDHADGTYLYERGGRRIIDGISSWWVITHGHCHPHIAEAVKVQADKLEQVIFAGFTHTPAERLAEKLLRITDPKLQYVFFSDSGSTAVEVALKMAIGYFVHTGQPRRKILALNGGYHGDTFGAMAAGARSVFNKLYEPYLFEVEHLPFPDAKTAPQTLQKLETFLKGGDVAALILEPIVQGAAGMRIYSPKTLKKFRDLCTQYGTLLIADEVMTGFGRTGKRFACEHAKVTPDIVCLSKGLTGGFLPMGATLCTRDIYDAFYHEDRARMFFHSTSFTGNPLACAAALANLEIWDREPVFQKIQAIETEHKKAAAWFDARTDVADVRTIGSIFALDVQDDVHGYLSNISPVLYDFFLKHDVLLRPIGNTIYILPPYCVTQTDLEQIYDTLWRSLDSLRDESKQRAA